MAGYTKQDFDSLYRFRVRIWDESIQAYRRSPIRLNYHRYVMQEIVRAHWDKVVPMLGITSSDIVVVVGAAFGWGVERLQELTGCTAIGIDNSDYINANKLISENAEVEAAIIAAGYNINSGHGLEVYNAVTQQPRSSATILQEDLSNQSSRNAVKAALSNQTPTWIITEDMFSDFNDTDALAWQKQAKKLSPNICHILRELKNPNSKTGEEWQALTGKPMITIGDYRRVG